MMTESQTESQANPVLIAIAPNEMAAHMLQHVLETHDIESVVFGGNAKSVLFWSVYVRVRIEVRQCDYDRAREVLVAFRKRIDASIPEQTLRGHCVVCGHDRAGLDAFEHCPECGAQASVWKINEGQFEIAPPLDERSSATASFIGYAVLVVLAVFMVIGAANLLGFI